MVGTRMRQEERDREGHREAGRSGPLAKHLLLHHPQPQPRASLKLLPKHFQCRRWGLM